MRRIPSIAIDREKYPAITAGMISCGRLLVVYETADNTKADEKRRSFFSTPLCFDQYQFKYMGTNPDPYCR